MHKHIYMYISTMYINMSEPIVVAVTHLLIQSSYIISYIYIWSTKLSSASSPSPPSSSSSLKIVAS